MLTSEWSSQDDKGSWWVVPGTSCPVGGVNGRTTDIKPGTQDVLVAGVPVMLRS